VKKPLLSVCIITYNHARYIEEAIDSILAQKVDFPWQLIIADDCSTDSTREILQAYKKKYPDLIHLILQKQNVGPERNWLDLIAYPKTKYLLYAEGDDYLIDPTKLQRQVDFLETHKDFSMCFHPVQVLYEDKPKIHELFPDPKQFANKRTFGVDDLLAHNFIQTNSVMYRWQFSRKNVKDVFPKNIIPGDWFLHLLHAEAGKIGFMNRVMAVYRRHPGGIWWESSHNVDVIWKKYGLPHLRFFVELLKRYGNVPKRASMIHAAIYTMLDTFISVDAKHDSHIFLQSTEEFPAIITAYAIQKRDSEDKDQISLQKQQQAIEELRRAKQSAEWHYEALLAQKQQQLEAIRGSKVWRLRNRLVKLLGRTKT
jgi:glycosyltransferase involved in cell wall biosynthesis